MERNYSKRIRKDLPFLTIAALLSIWHVAATMHPRALIPGPGPVILGIWELSQKGLLLKYVIASLFRVTWGYLSAIVLAVPIGLLLGWYRRSGCAFGPLLQIVRPISPLAWIPISILWFGVGDAAAIFLIFLASSFPLAAASMHAVQNVDPTYLRAGRNFGLSDAQLMWRILCPAAMPQLVVALRITLGIAWLVIVAAEMIAVNSGLGFLIVDARNAGNRYDLVVGGMALIGVIGLLLDTAIRRIERLPCLGWGYGEPK